MKFRPGLDPTSINGHMEAKLHEFTSTSMNVKCLCDSLLQIHLIEFNLIMNALIIRFGSTPTLCGQTDTGVGQFGLSRETVLSFIF